MSAITAADAEALERCVSVGGVAVFPADTVYGVGCDPTSAAAVARISELKGRPPAKPSAVMLFDLELALETLTELDARTRAGLSRLLPGGITALVPNPAHRFPLACGPDPETLGVRVPALAGPLEALGAVRRPVMATSANLSGGADPRRLADVPESLRAGADLVLDGGSLPGTPSTVVDLRAYGATGAWTVVRAGAVDDAALRAALD